jgi:hypothetical protein
MLLEVTEEPTRRGCRRGAFRAIRAVSSSALTRLTWPISRAVASATRNASFFVVEKLEEAAEVAIEHDPRS